MHQFFKFILFCSSTLQVSDGLSVHHQEYKTVHRASGICQTEFQFDVYLMLYVQSQTPDDGRKDRPKHAECYYKINLKYWCISLVLLQKYITMQGPINVKQYRYFNFNSLNPELNPICYLLVLLAHHFLHFSRIRVKSLTLRLLMSYIYIYIWSAYS